jgi:ferredoxin-nitrite reductase
MPLSVDFTAFPASHGEGETPLATSLLSGPTPATGQSIAPPNIVGDACPGLFYQTVAQDGFLTRIRLPGGRLDGAQAKYLATIAQRYGNGQIWLTNRSNVQLRLSQAALPVDVLARLQALGLAAADARVDHLRNIMASPTAGIDRSALMDVSSLVVAIDDYLSNHPELAPLSAKFSIGLDGGETVSIRDRRNDVWFVAESFDQLRVYFGTDDTGIVVGPADVVGIVATIGRIYLDVAPQILGDRTKRKSQKPRWREIVDYLGFDHVIELLSRRGALSAPSNSATNRQSQNSASKPRSGVDIRNSFFAQISEGALPAPLRVGINRQARSGLSYVGIVVPLGRLESSQLTDLAQLAETHGNGELRLTPWQNIIIPNIAQPTELQTDLTQRGYSTDPIHPAAALVACTGSPGCAASFTATQTDAMRISEYLMNKLDQPVNIHVSGCHKGCAQPYASDIALIGLESGNYDLYVRSGNEIFGELVRSNVAPIDLPQTIWEVAQC